MPRHGEGERHRAPRVVYAPQASSRKKKNPRKFNYKWTAWTGQNIGEEEKNGPDGGGAKHIIARRAGGRGDIINTLWPVSRVAGSEDGDICADVKGPTHLAPEPRTVRGFEIFSNYEYLAERGSPKQGACQVVQSSPVRVRSTVRPGPGMWAGGLSARLISCSMPVVSGQP